MQIYTKNTVMTVEIKLSKENESMGTFYLVDYENVGSGGVTKCSGLDKTDQLHFFIQRIQRI